MSNELVPFSADALPCVEGVTESQLAELSRGTDFLQRVQLVSKGKYVDTSKITPGHYGIPQTGGEEIEDLGETIDIIPLCVRSKALDMSDTDAVIAAYDMDSDEFKDIKDRSATKDSSCVWGPSFLVIERSTGQMLEFFMNNKSARKESGNLMAFLPLSKEKAEAQAEKTGKIVEPHGPLSCTLSARYAKSGSWGWHVPVVNKCSEPFINFPEITVVKEEMVKFVAAKDSGVQNVTEEEAKATKSRAR